MCPLSQRHGGRRLNQMPEALRSRLLLLDIHMNNKNYTFYLLLAVSMLGTAAVQA